MKNFRGFSEFEMEFRQATNLIVGDNASGKTSLLKGCKYALSAFFAGFSDENTSFSAPVKNDFRAVVTSGNTEPLKPIEITFDIPEYLASGAKEYERQGLVKKSAKNSRPLLSGFKDLREIGSALAKSLYADGKRKAALPLFAVFTTEDIHVKRKIKAERFKDYTPANSFGYYECLNADGLLKYWLGRMFILREAELDEELDFVKTALLDALGPGGCDIIRGLSVRPFKKKVFFKLADGREVATEMLSDGYRRLVNIVVDIAFRAYILNGNCPQNDAAKNSRGTVIIDEIDLHLHPSLQGAVLKGLRNAFPELQFIASTHSPKVMSGVRSCPENGVTRLYFDSATGQNCKEEIETYGLDASTIISEILKIDERDGDVALRLAKLNRAIEDSRLGEAREMLVALRNEFGYRIPDLTSAQTLLDLIEE